MTTIILQQVAAVLTTDNDRPHRCCHLANNFGSRRIISYTSQWARDAPKMPFLPGDQDHRMVLSPTHVYKPNGIWIDSADLAQLMVVTNS